LFAVSAGVSAHSVWSQMWNLAENQLRELANPVTAAVIPLQSWFQSLISTTEFAHTHDVIVLTRNGGELSLVSNTSVVHIREMSGADLEQVAQVDADAFVTLWRLSLKGLKTAFGHAAIATVAEVSSELVAYQISTMGSVGGHLARLAVKPEFQGLGIGSYLLRDLLDKFERRGIMRVSVNTQNNNLASLALYRKFGFEYNDEIYPVYEQAVGG